MPHAARLRKVGGSVMLATPKATLDALDLGPDVWVGLSIKGGGRLVVDPKRRRRYLLDDCWRSANPGRAARARSAIGLQARRSAAS